VLVFAIHVHGNMGCADSRWSIPTAVSLVDHGDFDLDEYLPVLEARGFYFTDHVRDHYYTVYPLGVSLLAAPAVVVLRPVVRLAFNVWPSLHATLEQAQDERGCPPLAGEPIVNLHSWTEMIIASAIVAATTAVVYAIAAGELGVGGAVLLALVFAFGTSAWSTASRSLWQHGASMLMLALALLAQVRRWPLPLMGLALAFAYVVRPTNIIPLALATAWVMFARPRQAPAYLAGVAAILIPFFLNNQHIYGAWLSPYYHPSRFHANVFFKEALAGDLISPGRGLFVYSPVFLFAPFGVVLKFRQRRFTMFDLTLVLCVLVHWIVVAWVNQNWWGGDSYGPRFLSDMIPYLVYFLIPVVAWIGAAAGASGRVATPLFGVAVVVSVLMQAQGVFNPKALAWNGGRENVDTNPIRLWDWRRPPFLAGWQAEPPEVDAGTVPCNGPPGAPAELRLVSREGSTLMGSWRASSGAVAEYILESGSAPGLSDFPEREVRDVSRAAVTVYRVPPGIYYARVRAKNACGVSPPSNEIAVTVQ
jgi:hypothetical protein